MSLPKNDYQILKLMDDFYHGIKTWRSATIGMG